jgi:hypothetical protein
MNGTPNGGSLALRFMRDEASLAADHLFAAGSQYAESDRVAQARAVYQDIIRTFSGSAYQGHRDRAKMELDIPK